MGLSSSRTFRLFRFGPSCLTSLSPSLSGWRQACGPHARSFPPVINESAWGRKRLFCGRDAWSEVFRTSGRFETWLCCRGTMSIVRRCWMKLQVSGISCAEREPNFSSSPVQISKFPPRPGYRRLILSMASYSKRSMLWFGDLGICKSHSYSALMYAPQMLLASSLL